MIAAICNKCGRVGCSNDTFICNNNTTKFPQDGTPFNSITLSITDVMINNLPNDQELGAFIRGLLNKGIDMENSLKLKVDGEFYRR